tara:strand:+ start:820 stop:1248 length:429 start_codon:yes stop_codon:yes gene_type:complete
MAQFEANKILDALENETNASIMNLTTSKIQKQKNDMLQRLQMPKSKLKSFHKKLKKYRYCSDLKDIQYGFYVRWIPIGNPENIRLTNGGIICDIKITENGIYVVCKNNFNNIFQFKFDECLIFQKLSREEIVILKVLDYLDK